MSENEIKEKSPVEKDRDPIAEQAYDDICLLRSQEGEKRAHKGGLIRTLMFLIIELMFLVVGLMFAMNRINCEIITVDCEKGIILLRVPPRDVYSPVSIQLKCTNFSLPKSHKCESIVHPYLTLVQNTQNKLLVKLAFNDDAAPAIAWIQVDHVSTIVTEERR